ncbi:MAG: DNA mismatch repair protein MutS [Hyphomicrobiales bacterium]
MAQFIEIKAANPGSLLFYRMGDFYELFFHDAEIASRALGITLTKRGKHLGEDIPMCGVPVHAADDYLQKLIGLGHKVAVCEQMEDPSEAKKRGAKSVVKRDVVRLVTPGTITEERLLDAAQNSFLAALTRAKSATQAFALAWIDMSTGSFFVRPLDAEQVSAALARIAPKELIVADAHLSDENMRVLLDEVPTTVSPVPKAFFDGATAEDRLCRFFDLKTLEGYGQFERVELSAAAAILSYVEKTQIGARPPLSVPERESAQSGMSIDAATRANLELMQTLSGKRKGSLFDAIDRTVTGAGARLLAMRLSSPSTDAELIKRRQEALSWTLNNPSHLAELRKTLKRLPDMARALSRLMLQRGGPRDLAAIRDGLLGAQSLADDLQGASGLIESIHQSLNAAKDGALSALANQFGTALAQELPLQKRDGGFVRIGFSTELDEHRGLRDESRKIIAGLQSQYSNETGVKSLKIRHNNVLGYFVEVTAQNAAALQDDADQRFIHRQTMANAMRFTTTELSALQSKIAGAADAALRLELELFDTFLADVGAQAEPIQKLAQQLAELDVVCGLATLADHDDYCRPIVDDSLAFAIEGGRHPVVEQALRDTGETFVANGCTLSGEKAGQIWLLTGPNMAGKSTFLRQNALITILAQIGSYVPAASAHIGIVDALYSRVGASDDLARGRSTFMVEMVETAAILNQAGPRALVILDEIGRGTATYDGLAIAWSAVEHLHAINFSRALFATHYHELTALSQTLERLSNATVKVKEWDGNVVFLHEIVPGAATSSYGIQVARLAGLPEAALDRARDVLEQLEAQDRDRPKTTLVDDLPLFSVSPERISAKATTTKDDPVLLALDDADPDDMTPRDALEALYQLKKLRNN